MLRTSPFHIMVFNSAVAVRVTVRLYGRRRHVGNGQEYISSYILDLFYSQYVKYAGS
jgi:hypothetical protein